MSSESKTPSSAPPPPASQPDQQAPQDDESKSISKKAAKKEAAKLEKQRRRQQEAATSIAAAALNLSVEDDPLASNYGEVPLPDLQSKAPADIGNWTEVGALSEALKDQRVLVRGRAQTIRSVSKNMAFVVVREKGYTVQCVVTATPDVVSRPMVKYVSGLSRESIVDVEGIVSVPKDAIKGATQQVG